MYRLGKWEVLYISYPIIYTKMNFKWGSSTFRIWLSSQMPSLGDANVITFFFFQFAADILSQMTSNLALKEFDQKRSQRSRRISIYVLKVKSNIPFLKYISIRFPKSILSSLSNPAYIWPWSEVNAKYKKREWTPGVCV